MKKAKRAFAVVFAIAIGIMAAFTVTACYGKHEHNAATDGKCLICGKAVATAGLKYELTESGDGYAITGFEGKTKNIIIPAKYNGKPVTDIGNRAFCWCDITDIDIPDTVTIIGEEAFYNCNGLLSIVIPDGVKEIAKSAFEGCSSLMSVKMPDCLEIIGDLAFYGCVLLENIQIPDSVMSIGNKAFANCHNLKYNEYDNSRYLGNDVNPCLILIKANIASTSFEVNAATKFIHSDAFDACSRLGRVTMGDNVVSIGNSAFNSCYALMSVELSENLVSIGHYAFTNTSLTDLELPEGLISIGQYAFAGTGIANIELPESVISIGPYAFAGCNSLTDAVIKCDGEIGFFAFTSCRSLKSVIISSGALIGEGAFAECLSLASVYYEGSESEWNAKIIGRYNESLTAATVYYYSQSEPAISGKFWYYGDNGETVVW